MILQTLFLILIVCKPRDFPYSKKLKSLSISLLPSRDYAGSPNYLSPKDKSYIGLTTTTQPKLFTNYSLSAKLVSFKIVEGKVLFQIISKINDRPVKKINRRLEEFEFIGISQEIPIQRTSITE